MPDLPPKSIQLFPRDSKLDARINKLTAKLRTSRGGLAALAIEAIVTALEEGRAVVQNGEVVFLAVHGGTGL